MFDCVMYEKCDEMSNFIYEKRDEMLNFISDNISLYKEVIAKKLCS